MFIAALLTITKLWEKPRCPTTEEWVKKYIYIYTHTYICKMEFYLAIKKNDTLWFDGKWMQLEDILLSELTQVQKDKGGMFSLIHGR
jgi:hypothetical protein